MWNAVPVAIRPSENGLAFNMIIAAAKTKSTEVVRRRLSFGIRWMNAAGP